MPTADREARSMANENGVRFEQGGRYFLVGYYDDNLTLPSIETLIYLGKNLLGEVDRDERWYFQEADSFARNGRVLPHAGRDNEDILAVPRDHLKDVLDPVQLADLLKNLITRHGGR